MCLCVVKSSLYVPLKPKKKFFCCTKFDIREAFVCVDQQNANHGKLIK